MQTTRRRASRDIEAKVVMASRRRCCLCVFLNDNEEVRQGQIAHLNRDPSDPRFDNLVFLCLCHHDEYDSRTSQSKGLLETEVRHYRDRLYKKYTPPKEPKPDPKLTPTAELTPLPVISVFDALRTRFPKELDILSRQWRFPFWQVANQADLFAYNAHGSDGICLIERIDLPDGRIVVACIETPGNPGTSITNAVEELCFQVCERFDIPPERLVWLEHYDRFGPNEWNMVSFETVPPKGLFANPRWTKMTPELWKRLWLRPKKELRAWAGQYESKVRKLFEWPTDEGRS